MADDIFGNLLEGIEPDETPIQKVPYLYTTKKSIGYADGYSNYYKNLNTEQKSGVHLPNGNMVVNKYTGPLSSPDNNFEQIKSVGIPSMLDNHSSKFRTINGYGGTSNNFEDPTYLIFDLMILNSESSLFSNNTRQFILDYSKLVPELNERLSYWNELTNRLLQIFPGDFDTEGTEKSGTKRHYIESIGGLGVLTKPIIDYPTEVITFTVTEDVAMTLQYLAELYNNLIYSYDTHRYLIPDNLLRFNMKITIRDVRNMKNDKNEVNTNISKFVYVLHDCQFDFMLTNSFGADIRRGGLTAGAIGVSAGGTISMNFKSYSKITAPLLISNSKIIDFKERDINYNYETIFDGDYKSNDYVIEQEKLNQDKNNITYRSNTDIFSGDKSKLPGGIQFPEINTSIRGFKDKIKNEIVEVRDVIINKVYEEVNTLITTGERFLGEKLGFTIGKTNVYYNSLEEKVTTFSFLFADLLDNKVDELLGRDTDINKKTGNVYGKQVAVRESTSDRQNNNTNRSRTNAKYPKGDVHIDGKYNEKYPEGTVQPQGNYNEKYPEGDVSVDGVYNEKYPEGDVSVDGVYNEKYPEGDVHIDGKYNEKYPNGDVNVDGKYNEKYPKGDVNVDGKYNEKYPEGTVQPQGRYNEKYPDGDVHIDGKYNEKYPDGDVHIDGIYNNNTPNGNIYNIKYKSLPPNKDLGNIYKNNN